MFFGLHNLNQSVFKFIILSSASSALLLGPSSEFLEFFSFCTFQLQNFHFLF